MLIGTALIGLTAASALVINPILGMTVGLISVGIVLILIIKNKREHLDERRIEMLKSASFHTLLALVAACLALSFSVLGLYQANIINEPEWFDYNSIFAATVVALFGFFYLIELYRKGEALFATD